MTNVRKLEEEFRTRKFQLKETQKEKGRGGKCRGVEVRGDGRKYAVPL